VSHTVTIQVPGKRDWRTLWLRRKVQITTWVYDINEDGTIKGATLLHGGGDNA
jgi:hypothetical protein